MVFQKTDAFKITLEIFIKQFPGVCPTITTEKTSYLIKNEHCDILEILWTNDWFIEIYKIVKERNLIEEKKEETPQFNVMLGTKVIHSRKMSIMNQFWMDHTAKGVKTIARREELSNAISNAISDLHIKDINNIIIDYIVQIFPIDHLIH